MNIGLDFDGVIADSSHIKVDLAKKLFDVSISPDDFKREIAVEKKCLLSLEQYRFIQKEVYGSEQVGLDMRPVKNALHFISMLSEFHNIVIITSRSEEHLRVAQKWSKRCGIDLPFIGVGHGVSKQEACKQSEVEVYVDDDLDKLVEVGSTVPYKFLYGWPYNKHEKPSQQNVCRISNWPDLAIAITTITRRGSSYWNVLVPQTPVA